MKQIFIESSYESFADLHDGEWMEQLLDSSDGTIYNSPFEDFCNHWWGITRAFVLPSLIIDVMHAPLAGNIKKAELWEKSLDNSAFNGALWKVAESAYSNFFHAYENLIVSILKIKSSSVIRVTDCGFNSKLAEELGQSLAGKLWSNEKIKLCREVRNALVHNGGKETAKLKKMANKPRVAEDDILISATDVKNLEIDLKARVETLRIALL